MSRQAGEPPRPDGITPHPALPGGRRQVHLAGFMGSGKSTVGRLLARRLVWNFLDLDALVERHAGKPVARLFEEEGETAFRAAERHGLRQAVQKPWTVLALGGGTLLDADNLELALRSAVVVWLWAPLDVLRRRCRDDGESARRPLWDPDDLDELYRAREPGYRQAHLEVDASRPPEEVVAEVAGRLGGPVDRGPAP